MRKEEEEEPKIMTVRDHNKQIEKQIYRTEKDRTSKKQGGVQDVVDEGGSLTDNKNTHDNDENKRYVLLIPVFAHLSPSPLSALQRLDQFNVEEGD